MSIHEQYAPGAASGAEVRKDGEKWTLVLVRDHRSLGGYTYTIGLIGLASLTFGIVAMLFDRRRARA